MIATYLAVKIRICVTGRCNLQITNQYAISLFALVLRVPRVSDLPESSVSHVVTDERPVSRMPA